MTLVTDYDTSLNKHHWVSWNSGESTKESILLPANTVQELRHGFFRHVLAPMLHMEETPEEDSFEDMQHFIRIQFFKDHESGHFWPDVDWSLFEQDDEFMFCMELDQ